MKFYEIEENKKPNYGQNVESRMKEYLEGTLDSTSIQNHKIELRTFSKKEEKISYFENLQKDNKIKTLSPDRIYYIKNSNQKVKQKPVVKQTQDEKKDNINSLELTLSKLRPHIINLFSIFQSLSISLNESNYLKISLILEKIAEAINILNNKEMPKYHFSDLSNILNEINYLYTIKQYLESIEKNIEFSKIDNDWKNNVMNNSNIFEKEIKTAMNISQEDNSEKKDKTFLYKKRFYADSIQEIERITKKSEKDSIIGNENNNNIFEKIIINKHAGRIPKQLKDNGQKGKKTDTHPANGLIKILRNSFSNIFDILKKITSELDKDITIFFP